MPRAEREFTALADLLRRPQAVEPSGPAEPTATAPDSGFSERAGRNELPIARADEPSVDPQAARVVTSADEAGAIRAARLFRAAVADALDISLAGLLRDIAVDIVARELRLGPVDLAAIVRRLLSERDDDGPLRIRVAPMDADLECGMPVVADPTLAPGDAVLECRTGSIDARLGVRLAAVLEALSR